MSSSSNTPALTSFQKKKDKILSDLAIPLSEYKDRSPKGSVDEGIRDLIDEINKIDGLVTTSSCAGRISVYLEGEKTHQDGEARENEGQIGPLEENERQQPTSIENSRETTSRTNAPVGGKGHGGKWLFVSHSPISGPTNLSSPISDLYYHNLFNLQPQQSPSSSSSSIPPPQTAGSKRFIRLQFEPLLLHILCATLPHALPPLSAAVSSGFRESGLQSLTCLTHPSTHHPILGIRSSGMTLQTVIGYLDSTSGEPVARSLVSEEYLALLVSEISSRFQENDKRRERFRVALRNAIFSEVGGETRPDWEDPVLRARRKREEGLRRRDEEEKQRMAAAPAGGVDGAGKDEEEGEDLVGSMMFMG